MLGEWLIALGWVRPQAPVIISTADSIPWGLVVSIVRLLFDWLHDDVRRKNNPRNLTPDELLEEWNAEQQAYYDSFEATGGFDDGYFDDEPGDIDETKSTSSSRWNKVFNAISNKLPWN